jgi:hypothetical protein
MLGFVPHPNLRPAPARAARLTFGNCDACRSASLSGSAPIGISARVIQASIFLHQPRTSPIPPCFFLHQLCITDSQRSMAPIQASLRGIDNHRCRAAIFRSLASESFVALIDSRYLLIEAWIFFGQRSISAIETRIFLVEACVFCGHRFIAPMQR